MPLEPIRYEDGRAMLLAGLRRHHAFADAARTIAAQWDDFRALGGVPHQRGTTLYGVLCGADMEKQTFEYMTGAEVAEFDPASDLGRMRVPPQHYAVFAHAGPAAEMHRTWEAIWHQWLPRSGRAPVDGPEFEVYGGSDAIEVWSPVEPIG